MTKAGNRLDTRIEQTAELYGITPEQLAEFSNRQLLEAECFGRKSIRRLRERFPGVVIKPGVKLPSIRVGFTEQDYLDGLSQEELKAEMARRAWVQFVMSAMRNSNDTYPWPQDYLERRGRVPGGVLLP